MSRLLSEILGAQEPQFSHSIRELEEKSGRPGHDVRLTSDLSQFKKRVAKDLGFDEADTTMHELYYALRHRSVEINAALEKQLGINDQSSPEEICQRVHAFIDSMGLGRDVWVIKHSVVKQLLKNLPPKKLMKSLGLRSIDSVLKRTSSYELLTLAFQVETTEWKQKMHGQFKKLSPSDLQSLTSTIYLIDAKRIDKLHKAGYKRHNMVVPNYETGSVLLLAPAKRFPLDTLALSLAVLQALYDIRVYSAYFRFISVKQSFGPKLHSALCKGLPGGLHGNQIGWRALQKHFNQHPASFNAIEQPHLQYEDVQLTPPVESLTQHIKDAKPWPGHEYGFVHSSELPVSLHLFDVVTNASNNTPYEDSTSVSGQAALRDELGQRYLSSDPVIGLVITILDE